MIGIALLGAGRMARVHAKGIGAAGGKLVTVFDVVEKAAASLATETGASVAGSVEVERSQPGVSLPILRMQIDGTLEKAFGFCAAAQLVKGGCQAEQRTVAARVEPRRALKLIHRSLVCAGSVAHNA